MKQETEAKKEPKWEIYDKKTGEHVLFSQSKEGAEQVIGSDTDLYGIREV